MERNASVSPYMSTMSVSGSSSRSLSIVAVGTAPPLFVIGELAKAFIRQQDRIKRLEDIINRAHLAFFSDSSDRKVSIAMHRILDEEVRKEAKP